MHNIFPLKKKNIHIIGIGGIGMSGIAEILQALGYPVQGSDQALNPNARRLQEKGIKIFVGHGADNVAGASIVVCSSAIKGDNPEIQGARQRNIPVISRAEMLSELMRFYLTIAVAGTHGKTTTTSLVAHLIDGLDPTVINGGIVNAYGTNTKVGQSNIMVVEADESDGTFVRVPASMGIVTNIDPEHLEHYGSFDGLLNAFESFLHKIAFYGFACVCYDDPYVRQIMEKCGDSRLIYYGLHQDAQWRISNIKRGATGSTFTLTVKGDHNPVMEELFLPMPGDHNIQNATAAVIVAHQLGVSAADIRAQLSSFQGVKRRFTHVGQWEGATIIDDYAHHPVEIEAVLKSARQSTTGRVIAVVQPHRYSRLHALYDGFVDCLRDADDILILPVYAAGESEIDGKNHSTLGADIGGQKGKHVATVDSFEAATAALGELAREGDMILCMGAGDITKWANQLPELLKRS